MAAARQWRLVCVSTGGAGHRCNDERADGQYVRGEGRFCMRVSDEGFVSSSVHSGFAGVVTGRGNPTRHSVAGSKRLQVRSSGRAFLLWQRSGGGRWACILNTHWRRQEVLLMTGSMDWAGSQMECSDPAS